MCLGLEDMKVLMFTTIAGSSVYPILKKLAASRKPVELTDKITIIFLQDNAPPVSEIYERFIFTKCVKKSDQSIAESVVALRKLART